MNSGVLLNETQALNSEQIEMATIGYARVSTDGQSLQSQTEALHAAGCGRVYSEKQSGVYTDRPQLAKAIAALAEGDCLVVCKLDRLARSTRDLLNTLDAIGKVGAAFRSLSDSWADTTTPHWPIDGHGVRWIGRVRATFDPHAHSRRSHQGAGEWCEVWQEAFTYCLPTSRGFTSSCCW